MFSIKRTDVFSTWLDGLKDRITRQRLNVRLRKAMLGNLGDVRPVGDGVVEMREHFGAGWRMYYIQRGETLIVMLGGGDKSTQSADIAKAVKLAAMMEE
ncbi:type II toxin-antitoxin system RelE/ParE family toxin [Propionivibrio sp.]|uniref:type II toxin-antitoxin system RelE/ParE family toxin n=1 Tax=Propionivibrio sp. TaxID=2212460 RepID=UPI0025F31AC5|nr:type II toxin-antitoxin system RelE/ParE family toxin [Propionivibrio sp.]MBK7357148.1 type II toxin-antitoxin system RelE/ParE family toxin [Propionivibrio sp.]